MRVIFLDIDGVLNSDSYFDRTYNKLSNNINYHDIYDNNVTALIEFAMLRIDPVCLNKVKKLANETDSSVFMTSSWSSFYYYDRILRRLIKSGLPINNYLSTAVHERGSKILDFVNRLNLDDYVIIDSGSFTSFSEKLQSHLVLVDKTVGFSDDDYNKSLEILEKGKARKKNIG